MYHSPCRANTCLCTPAFSFPSFVIFLSHILLSDMLSIHSIYFILIYLDNFPFIAIKTKKKTPSYSPQMYPFLDSFTSVWTAKFLSHVLPKEIRLHFSQGWSAGHGFFQCVFVWKSVSLSFLLRCNSPTVIFTFLKCRIWWFLVHSQGCVTVTTIWFRATP